MRCAQTMSAQLLPLLKPLWYGPVNLSILSLILCSMMMDRIFLMLLSRTMGRKFAGGPGGFFGFGRGMSVPSPRPLMGVCCSKDWLIIVAIFPDIVFLACLIKEKRVFS